MPSEPGRVRGIRAEPTARLGEVGGRAVHGARRTPRSSSGGRACCRTTTPPATPRTRGRTARTRSASAVPHWPAPVSVVSFFTPALACCSRPAAPRCSACASRRARRPRTCSRCAPACRAPARGGARGTAATASTGGRRRGPPPGISTYRSCETSWRIRSIGNSGAKSSGPAGCRVPGVQRGRRRARADRARCCTSGSASRPRRASYLCRRTVVVHRPRPPRTLPGDRVAPRWAER